jgi:hypothetical protein
MGELSRGVWGGTSCLLGPGQVAPATRHLLIHVPLSTNQGSPLMCVVITVCHTCAGCSWPMALVSLDS